MPRSYETAEDLRDIRIDTQKAWEILTAAPSPEVMVVVLNRDIALTEAMLATALNAGPSSIRGWRSGRQKPSPKTVELLQGLAAAAAYLLTFEAFRTPAAVGRWLSMPRVDRESGEVFSALDQLAAGDVHAVTSFADAMLSGTIDRRKLVTGNTGAP